MTSGADVYSFNDIGVIAGVGFPLGDYLSLGFSIRAFERTEIDATITATDLINQFGISINNFDAAVYKYLQNLYGTGYGFGLNAGVLLRLPIQSKTTKVQLAATVEDIGCTTIYPLKSGSSVPAIGSDYSFGFGVKSLLSKNSELNFDFDLRNTFDSIDVFEKVHAGIEYRHRLFALRAGYYEGYPTFGVSLDMPPQTRINLTTYEVEEGGSLWTQGQRLFLLQLVIGFNPI